MNPEKMKKLLANLNELGIGLQDDTTPQNLAERLYVATHALIGNNGDADTDADDAPLDALDDEGVRPVMMSTVIGGRKKKRNWIKERAAHVSTPSRRN